MTGFHYLHIEKSDFAGVAALYRCSCVINDAVLTAMANQNGP
jgi:NRPS condensation-like uncharacterized protein